MAHEANIFIEVKEWPNHIELFHCGRVEGYVNTARSQPPISREYIWRYSRITLAIKQTGQSLRSLGYEITKSATTQSVFWKKK